MTILNESLSIESLPPNVRATFIGGRVSKLLLHSGAKLYKFTDRALIQETGHISPCWSAVEPIAPGDTGLSGLMERAGNLNVLPAEFARARSAITKQWNSMSGLMVVGLQVPAYVFFGRCSAQQIDHSSKAFSNVVYIGGAWQVYVPNLDPSHLIRS